jgi:hypothetical protein
VENWRKQMLDPTTAADALVDALHLDTPPVGIAFVDVMGCELAESTGR